MSGYRDRPIITSKTPPGIGHIVVNEAAERFSFYGMRAILVVFMTQYLRNADGQLDVMTNQEATFWYHQYLSAAYVTPFFGALLADGWLGKFRTIVVLSVVYCFGHFVLAIDETRVGLLIGLSMVAIGSGGIKPCVSAHVGDQFGPLNQHLVPRAFSAFYFAINIGGLLSLLFAQPLLDRYGPRIAFLVPGVLMVFATVVFWSGRYRFAHLPPAGANFVRQLWTAKDGLRALVPLVPIYVLIAVFWALYDQQGSSWVLQAAKMDRHFIITWGAAQLQWLNPALVLTLIPVFDFLIYPTVGRFVRVTPLRKISAGLVLAGLAFVMAAWIEHRIGEGEAVNVAWQFVSYVLITSAEVLVSITGLEFSYKRAPQHLKSVVMGVFMLTIALGNQLTSLVNLAIVRDDGSLRLDGANYFLFFAGLALVSALVLVPFARRDAQEHPKETSA